MAVGSILLAVLALISMGIGVLTTPIPVVGAVFSFGAPALALLGIILGGKAMSRAKQRGAVDGTAQAGVIVSALAMVPALLTAMTCGVCNAMCADGKFETQRSFNMRIGQPLQDRDASTGTATGTDDGAPPPPPAPSPPAAPGAPPPAFPPPPIDPHRP
jgi:hypothetical protein